MKYWNSTLKSMTEYIPGEQPEDIDEYIKLNTNENAFPPSADILNAITKECSGNLRLYPNPDAETLTKICADTWGLSQSNYFAANGSDELFSLIFRGFIDRDQIAAFSYPSYSLYYTMSEANGIAYDKIDLKEDFSIDFAKFLKKKYALVIFCNPNNPTGTGVNREGLIKFLEKYKGVAVVDEAYVDFSGNSMIDLVNSFDNLIVTRSFSKSYSLAGLRVGIAAAHRDIIEGFKKIKDSYNVDRLAQAGAIAALKDKKSFNYRVSMINNNKDYLTESLDELGFKTVPSEANFIFTNHSSIDAKTLYEKLKENKILVRHFDGPRLSDYLRITVGSMIEIKAFLKVLRSIIDEI
ncbi:MAG TPA: histidinol-phosphate transaminase [Spirochaetota bacterium]|nr:histidinol-phosphate transaminase [Spirochaetota bacterium]